MKDLVVNMMVWSCKIHNLWGKGVP